MEALKRAIELLGGQARLAIRVSEGLPDDQRFGHTAVANWLQRGQVPAERVIDISRATNFEVLPHDLRPDLYPHPSDGLPDALKERAA